MKDEIILSKELMDMPFLSINDVCKKGNEIKNNSFDGFYTVDKAYLIHLLIEYLETRKASEVKT